jgi:hypothetical protein
VTTCGLALFVTLTDVAIYELAAERDVPILDRLLTVAPPFHHDGL